MLYLTKALSMNRFNWLPVIPINRNGELGGGRVTLPKDKNMDKEKNDDVKNAYKVDEDIKYTLRNDGGTPIRKWKEKDEEWYGAKKGEKII